MVENTIQVVLNIDAITSTAINSARTTADVVGLSLQLIEEAGPEAVGKIPSRFAIYEFGPPLGAQEQRLVTRRRWLLTKGFQDISLAIRHAFEEADFLLAIAKIPTQQTTPALFDKQISAHRRAANKANLPDLIDRIEAAIGAPLAFRMEMQSLNRARNCLEHRRGIVTEHDCDPGGDKLTITYPRPRIFYTHQGEEVEIEGPHKMPENAEEGDSFPVFMQQTQRTLEFPVGSTFDVTTAQFAEITFAVWYFAHDLRDKVRDSSTVAALEKMTPSAQNHS